MANGYFQLIHSADSTGLKLFAPRGEGKSVVIKEVMEYLDKHNIPYDLSLLHAGIKEFAASNQEEGSILLNEEECRLVRETYRLSVSKDRLTVTARFYPPSEGGEHLLADEFLKDLLYQRIKHGIKKEEIENLFPVLEYCTDIIVAEGTPARQGTDGRIVYYFDLNLRPKPTILEDDTVDYFDLNIINPCQKGDILARLIPEDRGAWGRDIYGTAIKPKRVEHVTLKYGKNIELSEDGLTLRAGLSGQVALVRDQVTVSDILTLDSIDNSTGNIDFDGHVVIRGNVAVNFRVAAQGNISVKGSVEGAYLEAGGDIVIARGMNGMGKGVLKSGGDVISTFIENAHVYAKGSVTSGSILYSEVVAGSEITVNSKKGFITGGRVCATNSITVRYLGSAMGGNTVAEVGVDPAVRARIQDLQREIVKLSKEIKGSEPTVVAMLGKIAKGAQFTTGQITHLKKMATSIQMKKEENKAYYKELEELQKQISENERAHITVIEDAYTGTKICIGDISMVVRNTERYCKFIISDGSIEKVPI